ncbi:MAG: hypothetical protein PVH50_12505 [Anaerolineae bacterium]|jgi:hypothetical protein
MARSRWEHRSICINYDRQDKKNWVLQRGGDTLLVGFNAILAAFDADGWELLSLSLESSRAVAGFGGWHVEPCSYRGTFRRKVEGKVQTVPDRSPR